MMEQVPGPTLSPIEKILRKSCKGQKSRPSCKFPLVLMHPAPFNLYSFLEDPLYYPKPWSL